MFSTIFRATYDAELSTELSVKDCSGLDPLPEHLAEAHLTLGSMRDQDWKRR